MNEYRIRKGLKPLQANSYISSVALGHSRDMLAGRTPFGHEGFHERIDRIRKRLGPLHVAAENVASGPMSAREVVDGWLHSPGHRRNIEGDFRLTGIGLAFGRSGMIYFTQIFAK
ncbi:MAG: CAP domain-containing protein [Bacteroidetes bacterium]|nr:CAP domain-containing protein [Bacteroidota bacterium]